MKLNFLGDVFLEKKYISELELDMFIINLEYPLSKRGIPAKGKINLGSDGAFLKETFGKFPTAVTLANNHIMDFGEDSYLDTVEYLEKNNIAYFGAGTEANNFNNPAIIDFEKMKVALMGYSCPSTHAVFGNNIQNGSAVIDENRIIKDIQNAQDKADKIVIVLHWGDEFIRYPKPSDVKIARKLIDAGADIIIGHHAHIVQSVEKYRGKHIFYGLGNCIFPDFKLPSFYDGDKFTRVYASKWTKQNRQCLVVDIDKNFDVSYRTALFDEHKLVLDNFKVPKWIPKTDSQYNLHYKFSRRLGTLKRFFKNPKIPTLKQIKIFFNLK